MSFTRFSSILALFAAVSAVWAFPQYVPPGDGDVRSPCPGLNSLANHGFLPHSGKGITVSNLAQACKDGYNVSTTFCTIAGVAGLMASPHFLTFDLDNLDKHNFPIEHDTSLSRQDAYFGDNHSFNATVYALMKGSVDETGHYTTDTAGPVRAARLADSVAHNPKLVYTFATYILAFGESALYLSVMGDPATGVARADYVDMFFEQERLPYELGWTASQTEISTSTLNPLIKKIAASAGDQEFESSTITDSTIHAAFGALGL